MFQRHKKTVSLHPSTLSQWDKPALHHHLLDRSENYRSELSSDQNKSKYPGEHIKKVPMNH